MQTYQHKLLIYYTIIDFNIGRHKDSYSLKSDISVDLRIYLPEKVIVTKVNITFKGIWILMSTDIEVNNYFVTWLFKC